MAKKTVSVRYDKRTNKTIFTTRNGDKITDRGGMAGNLPPDKIKRVISEMR